MFSLYLVSTIGRRHGDRLLLVSIQVPVAIKVAADTKSDFWFDRKPNPSTTRYNKQPEQRVAGRRGNSAETHRNTLVLALSDANRLV
jgi:hypothetical protein